jgi:hypothetical protein
MTQSGVARPVATESGIGHPPPWQSPDAGADEGFLEPRSLRKPEQEITGCRWIHGDVGDAFWRYCQGPRLPGRSYCAKHHARSINPDGDAQFQAEQADCERYLSDLPPNDDEPWTPE